MKPQSSAAIPRPRNTTLWRLACWLGRNTVIAVMMTAWLLAFDVTIRAAMAWNDPSGGVSRATGNSLWCQLAGCAITGNVTVGGTLGVTGLTTATAGVSVPNAIVKWNTGSQFFNVGPTTSAGNVGMCTPRTAGATCVAGTDNYIHNASDAIWVINGLTDVRLAVANSAMLTTTAATSIFSNAIVASSALNKGSKTLSGGTSTATVTSGAKCTCTEESTAIALSCSVSGTTLTITAGVGSDVVSYHCF